MSESVNVERKSELAQEMISFCNYLGVEELTLDVDFNQPPSEIVSQLTNTIQLPVPESVKELIVEEIDNDETLKNIYKIITHFALLTYNERLFLKRGENGIKETGLYPNPSDNEDIASVRENLADYVAPFCEQLVQLRIKHREREVEWDESDWVKEGDQRELGELLHQDIDIVLSRLEELDFSLNYSQTPEGSMLRFSSLESQELNCISNTAALISTLYQMGLPESQVKVFVTGHHIGALIKLDRYPYLFDPAKKPDDPKAEMSLMKLYDIYPTKVSIEDLFTKYSLKEQGIVTYGDFLHDLDPITCLDYKPIKPDENIGLLFPEEGIAAGLLINLGYVAFQNKDRKLAKRYFERALMFDPNNKFVNNKLESIN